MKKIFPPSLQPIETRSFRRDQFLSNPQAQQSAQEEDRGEDRLYRELLEFASEGIYGLDRDGYVTFVNQAARNMTGWTDDDLYGRTQHSMVHHSHADGSHYPRNECPIYAAIRDGDVHRCDDEVFWRKDGTSFPVAYTSSPIFRAGKPAGAVVIFRSLSAKEF